MQKFQDRSEKIEQQKPYLSDRIIVLCDEAHRTQYGTFASFMNQVLPNVPKIAFTGTPLITTDKTRNEFGSYIDTYTIEQSVADGATVQILYEGRQPKTKVTGDKLFTILNLSNRIISSRMEFGLQSIVIVGFQPYSLTS